MTTDNADYNRWIENCHREVERLFDQMVPSMPAHLQAEVQLIIEWNNQARDAARRIEMVKAWLRKRREEKAAAEASTAEIAARQSRCVEQELAERQLRAWMDEIQRIRSRIKRVTDKIIREMRWRKRLAWYDAKQHADEAARCQAADDLRVWEALKARLDMPDDPPSEAPLDDAHLQAEYQAFQARAMPADEDNRAAWDDFVEQLKSG